MDARVAESCKPRFFLYAVCVGLLVLMENKVTYIEICSWLGGFEEYKSANSSSFLTIEEVGRFLDGILFPSPLASLVMDANSCL